MKPLQLKFRGLNSYRSEQHVDFASLSQDGLFGIFGATGAGKSTILDAMTLALFGAVKRAPSQTQGIINSNEASCFVSFSFELSGHVYQAERLYKSKKDTPYSSMVDKCRLVMDESIVLADKNSTLMTNEVKKLLNMDFDRFCQTVILPQGQFDRLLRMQPRDRSAMFEELFRIGEYGKKLSSRAKRRHDVAEERLKALLEQQMLLGDYSDGHISALKQHISQLIQEESSLSEKNTIAQKKLHLLEEMAQKQLQRQSLQQQLDILAAEKPQMEQIEHTLAAAEKAEPLRQMLQQAVAAIKEAEQAQTAAEAAAAKAVHLQEKHLHMQQQLDALKSKETQLRGEHLPWQGKLRLALHQQKLVQQAKDAFVEIVQRHHKQNLGDQLQKAVAACMQAQQQLQTAEQHLDTLQHNTQQKFFQWDEAAKQLDEQRWQSATVLLASSLQQGEPCPVCGSTSHRHVAEASAHNFDLAAMETKVTAQKQAWLDADAKRVEQETALRNLRELSSTLAAEQQKLEQQQLAAESELKAAEKSLLFAEQQMHQIADCDNPEQELKKSELLLQKTAAQLEEQMQAAKQLEAEKQAADMQAALAQNSLTIATAQLEKVKNQLTKATSAAGFADANQAKKALLAPEQRQQLQMQLDHHQQQLQQAESTCRLLDEQLLGFNAADIIAQQSQAAEIAARLSRATDMLVRSQVALEQAEQAKLLAADIERRRAECQQQVDVLKRINSLLKGNGFVRYLSRDSLLELTREATFVLMQLTGSRYMLELLEDSRGSDFIIVDNMNGGTKRQVAGLSGGEIFLVSLALALALSRKIQMQGAPLGFFFLDEGFGSLGESNLNAVLDVLEKLPSAERSVGVITHVAGVRERVPRYLEVFSDGVNGSTIQMRTN